MPLPVFQPLGLERVPAPFSHPDWIFEIKWDGFRSLARVEHRRCKLISRKDNEFRSFQALNVCIGQDLKAESAIVDGEIVCVDDDGKPQFYYLLFRRGEPRFVAFDLLWCSGEDLRYFPVTERKHRLRSVLRLFRLWQGSSGLTDSSRRAVSQHSDRILFCDHVEEEGEELFQLACENDLEGIVAKRKFDPYLPTHTKWLKIRNKKYSQWEGREELYLSESARAVLILRLGANVLWLVNLPNHDRHQGYIAATRQSLHLLQR